MRAALLILSLLVCACSITHIDVDEQGSIQYAHWQLGSDQVGLSWNSQPAIDGGRYVDASMHTLVNESGRSAAQDTLQLIAKTAGGALVGSFAGTPGMGAGMLLANTNMPFFGSSDQEIAARAREEYAQELYVLLLEQSLRKNAKTQP